MRRFIPPILLLATLALAITATVVLEHDNGRPTQTITLGKPAQQRADVPNEIYVPEAGIESAEGSEVAHHDGLRTETADVPATELDAGREQQERLAASDQLPIVTPEAAPTQRGCSSRFVQNYSSRRGVRPRLLVLHYTVSPNRPGWSDVLGVVALFNRPAFAASSNYVIDAEGHCAYIVRESDKAWTQAAVNPFAISVEQINSGREGSYAGTAGLRKLALVFSDAARRWEIPVQRGRVSGCSVSRPGILDHKSLGACGGGHVDISPYGVDQVVAAIKAARGAGVTAGDRVKCRRLSWWRSHGRPKGKPEANAVRRRKVLERHHLRCTARGPVRA